MQTAVLPASGEPSRMAGERRLHEQLFEECRMMARHALASGLPVPGAVVQAVEALSVSLTGEGLEPRDRVSDRAGLLRAPAPLELRRLALAHERLAQIVAPATPQTIAFLQRESARGGIWGFLGPVPLVRHMMLASLVSICAFVAVSLSSAVNADPMAGDLLNSSGVALLLNELFFLSAAGLGASFAALFVANRFIANNSFDPKYNSSYWIRFVLGLIAGLILTTALPKDVSGALRTVAKPTLAILGGFSAAAVYRMMSQLIEAAETLVRGDVKGIMELREQALEARLTHEATKERLQIVNSLMNLKQQLTAGAPREVLGSKLDQIVTALVPIDLDDIADDTNRTLVLPAAAPAVEPLPSRDLGV